MTLRKGDVGARILISTNNTSLPGTDTLSLKVTKPSGATAEWTSAYFSVNLSTGVITYTTTATSDLDEEGEYQIEVKRVTVDNKPTHSDIGNFEVEDVLW
jgi:hypothetical protein